MSAFEPTRDPPERNFDWCNTETRRDGLTIVTPQSQPGTDTIEFQNTRLYENELGFITEGTVDFLDRFGDTRLSIPDYYRDFEDWTPYVGHVSVRDNRYGLGISHERFEAAIRLATGGGHYSTDSLTAIGCGGHGVIVQSPDGDFFVNSEPIREKPDGFSAPTEMVSGMIIEEEDTEVILGVPTFIDDAEVYYDTTIKSHARSGTGYHYFNTESGGTIRISGNDLARYASVMQIPEDAIGEYTYERLGDEFSCTWETIQHNLGDSITGCDGVCVGYNLRWDDPWDTSYTTLRNTIQAKAEYFYLSESEVDGVREYALKTVSDVVAEFVPDSSADAPSPDFA